MPYGENGLWYDDGPPFVPGGGGGSYPAPPFEPNIPPDGVPPDYQPALPFPNPYPAPPDRGPLPEPPPQQPPPSDPYNPPGGHPDIDGPPIAAPGAPPESWIAGIGGWVPSYFKSKVSRRTKSPFESQMDRLIRTGVRELGDYFRGGQALKMQPPPQPPMYRQWIGGDPNMDPGARLSAFIASRVFAIGALLYPSPLGVGTLTPAERRDEAVRASYNAGNFRMLGLPDAPAPPTYRDPRALPDLLLENIPRRADTGFRGFLRRELGGAGADFGRDWLANQLGVPRGTLPYPAREQGPPEPRVNIGDIHSSPTAQIPDPGTVATPGVQQVNVPSTAPGKRGTFGKGTRARQRIFTFGGLGTAVLLIEAGRRGRSPVPSARPGAPVLPSPLEPPIAIPTPTPLTPQQPSVQSYSPGYYGAAGADGYCIPRKRGPRRKCLERAPVKYSGGRRKGKAAGTKCLRWEAPKR